MRFIDYIDYLLCVMLYLVVCGEGFVMIQEILDVYGILKNYLMKVVQQFGELGWVDIVCGCNGGLWLFVDLL